MRRLAGIAALGLMAVAGCGSSAADRPSGPEAASRAVGSPSATSRPPATRGCKATVRYDGGQGGTGNIFASFRIEAEPGHRCRFQGRPTVTLIDRSGARVRTNQVRDRLVSDARSKGPVVDVRAGHPAGFVVVYRFGGPSGRGCRTAAGISVRLPPRGKRYVALVRPDAPDWRVFSPCGRSVAVTPIRSLTDA